MRKLLALLLLPLMFSCSGPSKSGKTTDSTEVSNNPLTADSITPPQMRDTAKLNEYQRDSLRMSIAFQRAANELSIAYRDKDIPTYTKYTHPEIVKLNGGAAKYMVKLEGMFAKEHIKYERIVSGPVRRTAASVDDQGYSQGWYCLIPVHRFRAKNGKHVMELQWLGGQTLDFGKHIYFIDVTSAPREKIIQIMPDIAGLLDLETGYQEIEKQGSEQP